MPFRRLCLLFSYQQTSPVKMVENSRCGVQQSQFGPFQQAWNFTGKCRLLEEVLNSYNLERSFQGRLDNFDAASFKLLRFQCMYILFNLRFHAIRTSLAITFKSPGFSVVHIFLTVKCPIIENLDGASLFQYIITIEKS